jgi:phage repressor protein C with HTH and peptisase S24 domain
MGSIPVGTTNRLQALVLIIVQALFFVLTLPPSLSSSVTYDFSLTLVKRNDCQVIIKGDSMEPEILSGAFVPGECVDVTDNRYESNGVYAVLYANRFVVKRINANDINDKKRLVLHSDNEHYRPIIFDAADIHCMWKIMRIVNSPLR